MYLHSFFGKPKPDRRRERRGGQWRRSSSPNPHVRRRRRRSAVEQQVRLFRRRPFQPTAGQNQSIDFAVVSSDLLRHCRRRRCYCGRREVLFLSIVEDASSSRERENQPDTMITLTQGNEGSTRRSRGRRRRRRRCKKAPSPNQHRICLDRPQLKMRTCDCLTTCVCNFHSCLQRKTTRQSLLRWYTPNIIWFRACPPPPGFVSQISWAWPPDSPNSSTVALARKCVGNLTWWSIHEIELLLKARGWMWNPINPHSCLLHESNAFVGVLRVAGKVPSNIGLTVTHLLAGTSFGGRGLAPDF